MALWKPGWAFEGRLTIQVLSFPVFAPLGRLRVPLGVLGSLGGGLWGVFGRLGVSLGVSWGVLGVSWGVFWEALGGSLGGLGGT